jgi:hypothetical protein
LCITGDWGVGKTYNWQTRLDRLRNKREVGLPRYSYVSLFGINSLENLKQSIFENLEFIVPEGQSGLDWARTGSNRAFKEAKKLTGAMSVIPYVGDALSKITQPFLFSSIKGQIICIDDLERKGKDLSVKDVFGLISYLREQRNCKIVLLLNEDRLAFDRTAAQEFKDYFEKVIDSKVVFAPTPEEASSIAFGESIRDKRKQILSEYTVKLRIRNIRVLKKIERLADIIFQILPESEGLLERQIVHSLVMLGWCQFDTGANPPTLNYVCEGSLTRRLDREKGTKPSEDEKRWDTIIEDYEFSHADDFDLALRKVVESGIVAEDEIQKAATIQQEEISRRESATSFEESFRPFHDSFADNEDEVCVSLVKGVEENLQVLSLKELDATVTMLRRLNRESEADNLTEFAVGRAPQGFWTAADPFGRTLLQDQALSNKASEMKAAAAPDFNFERDLVEASKTYNDERIARLAAEPVDRFVELFQAKTGKQQREFILAALEYRRISNATNEMRIVVNKAEEALRLIGSRSRLNAIRIEKYGIIISEEGF